MTVAADILEEEALRALRTRARSEIAIKMVSY